MGGIFYHLVLQCVQLKIGSVPLLPRDAMQARPMPSCQSVLSSR